MKLSEIREEIDRLIKRFGDVDVDGHSDGLTKSRVAAWEGVSDLSGVEAGFLGEADWPNVRPPTSPPPSAIGS